jgi:hypothetical protein
VFVDRIAAAPENETLMLDWNRERKSEDSWKDNIENNAVFRGRCFKNTFVPAVVVILTAGFYGNFPLSPYFAAWRMKIRQHTKSFDDRSWVSRESLQSAITEAVKKVEPSCEAFAGVVIKRETPKSRLDANWAIRGVRFGRADRDKSSQALATIVERAQRYFSLAEDDPDPPKNPASKSRRSIRRR